MTEQLRVYSLFTPYFRRKLLLIYINEKFVKITVSHSKLIGNCILTET